jgi:hypothetical protein
VKILILLNKQDYSSTLVATVEEEVIAGKRDGDGDREREKIQLSYQMVEEYKRRYLRNTIISSRHPSHQLIIQPNKSFAGCFDTQKFQFL